jgi:hypothetical protein
MSSNLLCSSSQSVSAVNPEAEGEKPRALAAFCWRATQLAIRVGPRVRIRLAPAESPVRT